MGLVYADGLGRVRQTQKHAQVLRIEQGVLGWTVSGQLRFDVMVRVAEQGQVRFRVGTGFGYAGDADEPHNATSFSYDMLGRTTRTVLPDGATTRVAYGFGKPAGEGPARFMATVTDARGNLRVVYRDAEERIEAVEEHLRAGNGTGDNSVPGWGAETLTTHRLCEVTTVERTIRSLRPGDHRRHYPFVSSHETNDREIGRGWRSTTTARPQELNS